MKANYVKKMAKQAFNKLVEAVEAGKSETLIEYLKTMGKFYNYSVGCLCNKKMSLHLNVLATVAGYRTFIFTVSSSDVVA